MSQILTHKARLTQLARDYGAVLDEDLSWMEIDRTTGAYTLGWPGGRACLRILYDRPVLTIADQAGQLPVLLDFDSLRERGMLRRSVDEAPQPSLAERIGQGLGNFLQGIKNARAVAATTVQATELRGSYMKRDNCITIYG